MVSKMLVFWLLFRCLSCLGRSGRLVGWISTKFRPNPSSWCRVMIKKLNFLTSIKLTSIKIWAYMPFHCYYHLHFSFYITLRSFSSLFSDFSRNFAGVISGGVRTYLGGIWRSFWSCLKVIWKEKPRRNLPPKNLKNLIFSLLKSL